MPETLKLLSKGEIVQTRLFARDKGSFRMLRQQLTIGTKLVTIPAATTRCWGFRYCTQSEGRGNCH